MTRMEESAEDIILYIVSQAFADERANMEGKDILKLLLTLHLFIKQWIIVEIDYSQIWNKVEIWKINLTQITYKWYKNFMVFN